MIIMHIDANSAYLSWTAANMLKNGYETDIREIPSAIAGNPETRHGVILAKSISAKKFGVKTGESLLEARKKCPQLKVFPPDYDLYMNYSDAMYNLLLQYSPLVQRYSIDECYMDYTASEMRFGEPVKTAYEIKERIKNELGYTVNIGVSSNKLLAKMGSELKKPDRVHTLFPDEIEEKMWPLPVGELFMVGKAAASKLRSVNIFTIGDLANTNVIYLKTLLKSQGELIWNYANGLDCSPVVLNDDIEQKGISNSITLKYNVASDKEAKMFLLSLSERVTSRLRKRKLKAGRVSIIIKDYQFNKCSHQTKLYRFTDSTMEIYKYACSLFDLHWDRKPIRLIGISVGDLSKDDEPEQLSLFQNESSEKERMLDKTIDLIRSRYGQDSIKRGTFVSGGIKEIPDEKRK